MPNPRGGPNVAPLTYVSLFAGAGSLDLGIRIALPLAQCIGYVEIETTAAEILVARFADGSLDEAPLWSDIRGWPGELYRGAVDLAILGPPCQPFSVAGKQLGDKDSRYLWPSIFRAIESCSPTLVFLEYVPLLLRWFEPLGERLSSLGYGLTCGLFSAAEVGAPHRRERFFALAHAADSWRRPLGDGGGPGEPGRHAEGQENGGARIGDAPLAGGADFIGTDAFPPGRTGDEKRWNEVLVRRPWLRPSIARKEAEPHLRQLADGMASLVGKRRTDALRAVGNGVVPLQAAWAFVCLAEAAGLGHWDGAAFRFSNEAVHGER